MHSFTALFKVYDTRFSFIVIMKYAPIHYITKEIYEHIFKYCMFW